MKKILLYAFAFVAASAVFSACEMEELSGSGYVPAEDEIMFAFGKGTATKSSDRSVQSNILRKAVYPISNDVETGTQLYLEETVTSLDGVASFVNIPETKGTPIYTENVGEYDEYKAFNLIGYAAGTSTVKLGDTPFNYFEKQSSEEGNLYRYKARIAEDPKTLGNVRFFMRMPVAHLDGPNVEKEEDWSWTSGSAYTPASGTITFNYNSPQGNDAAKNQKDILFASKVIDMSKYDSKKGEDIEFFHALTAVKFRVGNDNAGDTKTIIKKVEFSGLKSNGTCTMVFGADGNPTSVRWQPVGGSGDFIQEFAYTEHQVNTYDYSGNEGFGSTFYSAEYANTQNLNNADGEYTFWFIPQTISDNVTLKVWFAVDTEFSHVEDCHTINFGRDSKQNKGNGSPVDIVWEPGHLITYTLKPNKVGVDITDDYSGAVKSNVCVTNTGNVHEYIRLAIIGNWCNASGDITSGYTSKVMTNFEQFPIWDLNSEINGTYSGAPSGFTTYGKFENFATKIANSGWIQGKDGYFYYSKPIGPGVSVESEGDEESGEGGGEGSSDQAESHTTPIFTKYEVEKDPIMYLPVYPYVKREQIDVHLEMILSVQAILAPGTSTESAGFTPAAGTSYLTEWTTALGYNPTNASSK